MRSYPSLPRRGDFGARVLCGAFDPVLEDGTHRASYFGLVLEGSWPYAVVTGETGTTYALHRNVQHRTTRGVLIQRSDGAAMRVMPESVRAASGGRVARRLEADHDVYEGEQYPGGAAFTFRSGEHVSWEESDGDRTFLRLEGDLLAPGFHVHTPWRGGGMYYTSLCWRVEGEMFGEPVSGFALLDQSYLPHGAYWNDSPVWNRLQRAWSVFANAYADGTVEFGHLSHGADGFSFGVISDAEGPILDVRDEVAVDLDWGDDGFARRVDHHLGGQTWSFALADEGAMVDASAARPGWRGHVGTIRRSDDHRELVAGFGWQELFPDRL